MIIKFFTTFVTITLDRTKYFDYFQLSGWQAHPAGIFRIILPRILVDSIFMIESSYQDGWNMKENFMPLNKDRIHFLSMSQWSSYSLQLMFCPLSWGSQGRLILHNEYLEAYLCQTTKGRLYEETKLLGGKKHLLASGAQSSVCVSEEIPAYP